MYEYIDFFEGNYQKGDMNQRKVYMNQRKVYQQKAISLSNEDENAGIDGLLTKGRPPKIYALYKGDKFIDIGTLKEMSDRYTIKLETLRWLSTGINTKRLIKAGKKDGYVVVRLDK